MAKLYAFISELDFDYSFHVLVPLKVIVTF